MIYYFLTDYKEKCYVLLILQIYKDSEGELLIMENKKDKMIAGLLGIFLGSLGIHKFYLGYTKEAVIPYLYTSVMKTNESGAQYTWAQLKEEYQPTVESELKTFNEAYKKFVQ